MRPSDTLPAIDRHRVSAGQVLVIPKAGWSSMVTRPLRDSGVVMLDGRAIVNGRWYVGASTEPSSMAAGTSEP